ncbi:hypothetical protein [Teredinibacter turnerae]|uniref:hypothetical protein n=1 Tax=Teredinibacter turnerae TaxID=2426 RepID=UPI00036ACCF8|nr:hypothetical protein [Teredinibacter turnerae]
MSGKITKNTRIVNPGTGLESFGVIPDIDKQTAKFFEGHIYLKHGEHIANNRGFGASHIWEQHKHELDKYNIYCVDDVAGYVASILISGASIHYEYGKRLTVSLRSAKGIVIVEEKSNAIGEAEYSVVTAYPKRGNPHGSIIGALK